MPTRIKICGISRLEDAELAVELGASALGFNFYPQSPRYIAAADAFGIIRLLPPFVMMVGVFAGETNVNRVTDVAREDGERGAVAQPRHSGPRRTYSGRLPRDLGGGGCGQFQARGPQKT